ncbi:hypothetical protein ACFQ61_08095 [Streptomyces sp. NPDC056500]|uniref:hypothetical protein n=1 Tax=Streptomyces sp. NPDC056500 TaxID=3345840 RepID=UPI0036C57FC2
MTREPKVWPFQSTSDAYDATQCDPRILDGDVLLIENEKVIGIAYTWPFALTAHFGDLHVTTCDELTGRGGKYAASLPVAEREAVRMGVQLTRVDAAVTEPADKTKEGRA